MAAPRVYDLSYLTNIGGLYLPYEYLSNFAAGEELAIVRQILHPIQDIASVSIVVKATPGAQNIVLSKVVTPVLSEDGQILQQADHSVVLTFLFSGAETLLLDDKNYFVMKVTFVDNTSMVISNGYMQAGLEQGSQSSIPASIVILNQIGQVSVGQIQIQAEARDANDQPLANVPLFYFSSNLEAATISDTGLMDAVAPVASVIITVGTTQGNLASRITLSIV